jgi:3-hydroxybutyryl-CoA dehydratase
MRAGDSWRCEFTVTEELHRRFGDLFEDGNPLHRDDEYARAKGFREKVVFGNVLNGFISHFVGERLPVKNVAIYSQKIDYLRPVYVNDVLTLHVRVEDFFESVNVVELKFFFEDGAKVRVARGALQVGVLE